VLCAMLLLRYGLDHHLSLVLRRHSLGGSWLGVGLGLYSRGTQVIRHPGYNEKTHQHQESRTQKSVEKPLNPFRQVDYIENHWIAAKARPRNIMKNVSTMVQKDLKHIALSLLVRGSAGAQMNHWLLVYT
jgi:hypothetical protein